MNARALALAAPVLAVACSVGPDFSAPGPLAGDRWHASTEAAGAVLRYTDPDPRWWGAFNDPVLSELIDRAIRGNLNLQQAVLRVVEARQNVAVARAAGLPTLNATGSYRREQLGTKGVLESYGIYRQLNTLADQSSPLNQLAPGLGAKTGEVLEQGLNTLSQPFDLFQYGLDASWELDLFGRVRRSVEQARATTEAQQEATNDALIMLEGEVAQTYLQLRGAQALYASQQANIRAAQASLDLTTRLQRQGLGTALDVDQSRTQLLNYQRQLPGYEKQALQAVDELNLLLGEPPGTLDATLTKPVPFPPLPRVIDVGVPSSLARRRPDIRQAEAQLHAATAGVGVAVAGFYPDIALTGNLGIRATDASYLTHWASHFYSAGPSISLPIFQGGRLTASLRLARAQQVAAALNYRGTVLNALREVEDDLVAYRTDSDERAKLEAEVKSAEDSLYLATNSFAHGLSTFLQVLTSEESVVQARQQLVQVDVTLANDVVSLYRALGGGWQDAGAAPQVPSINPAPPPLPAALDSVAAGTAP